VFAKLGAQRDTHAHLPDLPRKLGAEIPRLWTERDTSASKHRTLTIPKTSMASTFLRPNLATGTSDFASSFCVRGTLAKRVEVVHDAKM
jgi:hypothetical protein